MDRIIQKQAAATGPPDQAETHRRNSGFIKNPNFVGVEARAD